MKKIALLLAIVLLLGCIVVFTSCGEDKASIEDEISSAVKAALSTKLIVSAVVDGGSLWYKDHTMNIQTIEEGEFYKVSGTVYAMSSGKTYSATYYAEVEYDSSDEEFDADVVIGSFN